MGRYQTYAKLRRFRLFKLYEFFKWYLRVESQLPDDGVILMTKIYKAETGFTLIELMIAIALGLLVTAAAIQLFMGGSISYRLQQNVAEVQDGGIFGLDYITQQIQLANYGNADNLGLTDQTPRGGVILSSGIASTSNVNITSLVGTSKIEDKYLSQSAGATGWNGLSNTTTASDQLTTQFIAPVDMFNCEGEKVFKGDLVVQRYFLRSYRADAKDDSNVASLGLACDANTPSTLANVTRTPVTLSGFGTTANLGEIIIPRVDQFKIKVLAKSGSNYQYYTLNNYLAAAKANRTATPAVPVPEIQLIKISVLIRSQTKTELSSINPSKSFDMLGEAVTLKTASTGNTNRYAREVYETTISLRNGYKES